jgi:PAS domain S-box-containing protein
MFDMWRYGGSAACREAVQLGVECRKHGRWRQMVTRETELTAQEEHALHERWIAELEKEYAPLFEACPDGVYIYIDDEHKTCNQKLADLLGQDVRHFKAMESYLDECVDEGSIDLVIHTYMKHFAEETRPIRIEYVARRSDGTTFPATLHQVPIVHDGELMVLGFIKPSEGG